MVVVMMMMMMVMVMHSRACCARGDGKKVDGSDTAILPRRCVGWQGIKSRTQAGVMSGSGSGETVRVKDKADFLDLD
jgi:hypothetical protein